ncbi:MAG: lysophospholipase [Actinobacteria bacterium]|nr:lysophospholipase [Actinomycetota bacterium]
MTASHEEGRFEGAGGVGIYWQGWVPPDRPRAVIVLAHGASEHGARYGWVAERLTIAGYALYALDHRGHGRSDGPRALIDRVDRAVEDIDTMRETASGRHPGAPVFLLGHSMGGCLAISYALRHEDRLAGLVLSGPVAALETASPVTRGVGAILSAVAPKVGVFTVDPKLVSRDPEVVRDYEQDPLNHHGKLPARTVAELSAAVRGFPDRVPELRLPLLVMYGTADELVAPEGSVMVHERAGSADKRIVAYEGLAHEILNEPERELVVADLIDWLDGHTTRA